MNFKNFILIVDDFYKCPQDVTAYAQGLDYYEVKNATGFRSRGIYQEPGMKKRFEKLLGLKIKEWGREQETENGIFFLGFSSGKQKEIPAIHADWPYNQLTAVVYLTPNISFEYGTSFWKHKQTGLTSYPNNNTAKNLKMPLADLKKMFEDDAWNRSKWWELERIAYKYNRLIAFPSAVFHSASRHFGNNKENGRIFQTFRINVEWNTFNK